MEKFLFYAIKKKDSSRALQLLLTPGYDINAVSRRKLTPLILAAKLGLTQVVEGLLGQQVNLSQTDGQGRSALHHACSHGHTDIVKLLVYAGCNVNVTNEEGDGPLHEAISSGSVDAVQVLLEAGSDVNRLNHVTGNTPLELAVLHENSEIVSILLRHGADAHHTSRARETALHFAVQVGSKEIMEHLIKAGVNMEAVNIVGETALAIAVQARKLKSVQFLIQAGCDLYQQEYMSPLCLACRQNSPQIICYLLSEGYNASRDLWVRRYSYLKLEESNPDLLQYVYFRCENPLTLKEVCRVVLRKLLLPRVADNIQHLCLPRILEKWVADDIIYSFTTP